MWTVSQDGTTLRFEIGAQYRKDNDYFRLNVRDGPVPVHLVTRVLRHEAHGQGHAELFDILDSNLIENDGVNIRFEMDVQYFENADTIELHVWDGPVQGKTLVFRDEKHPQGHAELFDILDQNLRAAGVPAPPE